MNDEYQRREFFGEKDFHEVIDKNTIRLVEPDKKELYFLVKSNKIKTTEIKLK